MLCRRCELEKPVADFHKNKRKPEGIVNVCKACAAIDYRQNRDVRMQAMREYYWKNKEHRLEQKRLWVEQNRERRDKAMRDWLARNKESHKKQQAEYRRLNSAKIAAGVKKRQTAKLKRTPLWLTDTHFSQIDLYYEASRFMSQIDTLKFHVDHIVPLQGKNVSGLHVPWNLQVLEASENRSKKNRMAP